MPVKVYKPVLLTEIAPCVNGFALIHTIFRAILAAGFTRDCPVNETIKYTIFKTNWGYFGLAASEKGLLRTCLPLPTRKAAQRHLLKSLDNPQFKQGLLKQLQDRIIAYFKGKPTAFTTPLDFGRLPPFTRKVLMACAKIPFGQTLYYSKLAGRIGKPVASRAVGNALARNPLPLIIPCHRVVRADGSIGRFSAPGGSSTKKRLIELERG